MFDISDSLIKRLNRENNKTIRGIGFTPTFIVLSLENTGKGQMAQASVMI